MKSYLIAFILLLSGKTFAYDIIANQNVKETTLTKNDVVQIFKGNKLTWSDGGTIKVSIIGKNTSLSGFLTEHLQMPYRAYTSYWKKVVFSGKAALPKKFASDADIVDYVANTPGSIGFVSSSEGLKAAKVISVK